MEFWTEHLFLNKAELYGIVMELKIRIGSDPSKGNKINVKI